MGKEMSMLDWMKGSDALNLVVVGRHVKQDENGTPEIVQEYSEPIQDIGVENDLQGAVENYGEQQQKSGEVLAKEIPNQSDYMETLDENTSADNYTQEVTNVVNTDAGSSDAYEDYRNLVPTDDVALPDYDAGYVAESDPQNFPGKEPITDAVISDNSDENESKKKKYDIRFSDGEKVFYDGAIYSVIMPPGALDKAEETGILQLAIYGEGGKIVDQTELEAKVLTPQHQVEVPEWDAAWTAQTGIGKTPETQTETETAQEESPPDETVTKPVLIYFEAYRTDDNSVISTINNTGEVAAGSYFIVKWKVDNENGRVMLQSDGFEKEGLEGQTSQLMGEVAMNYSLLAFDKEDNALNSWTLTVESGAGKENSGADVVDLKVSPDKKEIRWKINNFNPSKGLQIKVTANGVVSYIPITKSEGGIAI